MLHAKDPHADEVRSEDPYRDGTCAELTTNLPLREQLQHCLDCSGLAPTGQCWMVSMRVAQALASTRGQAKGDLTPFAPLGNTTKSFVNRALAHLGRAARQA